MGISAPERPVTDLPPGCKSGGWLSNAVWWAVRRVLLRRCLVSGGAGADPTHPDPLPSGRPRRRPRCHGAGRVARSQGARELSLNVG